MRFDAMRARVGLGLAIHLTFVPAVHAGPVVPAPMVPGPASPAAAPLIGEFAGQPRNPAAEAALREGQGLLQSAKYSEAVGKLDLAIALAPSWSEPVKLRAEAFAALAERHAPSEAFLKAQAADLERLIALEPDVDAAARQQRLFELRREAVDAKKKEGRRRKLDKPAFIFIALNITMLISGALMTSFVASEESLEVVGVKRYVYTGAVMLALGGGGLGLSLRF